MGFGKALWRRTDKLGRRICYRPNPLGGYVKMLDERAGPVIRNSATMPSIINLSANERDYCRRSDSNFIFVIFAYWLVFIIGVPAYVRWLAKSSHSIAAEAQIAPGTELKAVVVSKRLIGMPCFGVGR
ncbi:hypothetical protein ACLK1T_06595 [Escherichia coli]